MNKLELIEARKQTDPMRDAWDKLRKMLSEYFRNHDNDRATTPVDSVADLDSQGQPAVVVPPWQGEVTDMPEAAVPSLEDRVRDMTLILDTELSAPAAPSNMTVVDCYTRNGSGTEFLGKLYINADTGRDYKFVSHDGRTEFFR